jgi:diaminopimelate decarboxylase
VSAAGALVSSVIGTNIRNGRRWAYLDDGIYGGYSIKLYENHEFGFYCINRESELRALHTCGTHDVWTVAGPTCFWS